MTTPIPWDKLTDEEKDLLEAMARFDGWDVVEKFWQLILDQARSMGQID